MGIERLAELAKDEELVKQLTPIEQDVLQILLIRGAAKNHNAKPGVLEHKSLNPEDMSYEELMGELKKILEKDPELRNRISPHHRICLDTLLKQETTKPDYILVKREQWEALMDLAINQLKPSPQTAEKKGKRTKKKQVI